MRYTRPAAMSFSLLLLTIMPALPQQPAQPQFKSSELQVTVNRAKRNAAGQLAASLVFLNVSRENVALYGTGGAAIMTDTGETAESRTSAACRSARPVVRFPMPPSACMSIPLSWSEIPQ